jgi:hypothetical protein
VAEDIQHFTVTIPTGSTEAAPARIEIPLPPRTVRNSEWKDPPGGMGTMSFLVSMGGVPVLPVYGKFTYVTADNKDGTWNLDKYPDSGGWEVTGYNTGNYAHSLLLTFHCDLPAPARPGAGTAARPGVLQLMPAPDLSRAGRPLP